MATESSGMTQKGIIGGVITLFVIGGVVFFLFYAGSKGVEAGKK